ncbi:MAG: group 1 truncated hemoglobin [bacterium]|nr:group 1 truncated hemoglobin [bacterium]
MNSEPSLYEKIGGAEGVENLIGRFYQRIFADNELRPFFEETSVERLEKMQREFFSAAFGGPVEYSGIDLRSAHYDRGIRREHFSRYVEHLLETTKELGISESDVNEIVGRISTYAGDILGDVSESG